jgi:anti-anti-sigma factor
MDDDLRITATRDGSTAIVTAAGEIDLSNVGELRDAVTEACDDCDRLRLDLSDIEFIDSTGLGGLLELRSMLRARSVTLEIAAGDGPVRQAVEITGLGELLAS